jgi:hypothetical protein
MLERFRVGRSSKTEFYDKKLAAACLEARIKMTRG